MEGYCKPTQESLDEFMAEARQGSIPDPYEGEEQAHYDFLRSLPR